MGGAEGAAPRQGLGLDEAPPGARVATGLARAAICSLYALERRRRDDKAHGNGVDGAMRHVDRAECEDALPRAGGRGTAGGHDANKSSRSFTTGFSATRATCRKACHRHTRHDDEVTADLRALSRSPRCCSARRIIMVAPKARPNEWANIRVGHDGNLNQRSSDGGARRTVEIDFDTLAHDPRRVRHALLGKPCQQAAHAGNPVGATDRMACPGVVL